MTSFFLKSQKTSKFKVAYYAKTTNEYNVFGKPKGCNFPVENHANDAMAPMDLIEAHVYKDDIILQMSEYGFTEVSIDKLFDGWYIQSVI